MNNYKIATHPIFKYKHLDPTPNSCDIEEFYHNKYYKDISNGVGKPNHLNRLVAGGEEARTEKDWLHNTLYNDIAYILDSEAPECSVLDIGCGTGELVEYLDGRGFDSVGIEPSPDAVDIGKAHSRNIYNHSLESYAKTSTDKLGAVTLVNVLEHVPDPIEAIDFVSQLLAPKGIICVVVPNDFTEVQAAIKAATGKSDDWWIAIPDHINYFNFSSIKLTLEKKGYDIIYTQSDFPIELFILMGEDYITNPELGKECHKKRIKLEASMPHNLRRKINRANAAAGVGRACLMFGRKK